MLAKPCEANPRAAVIKREPESASLRKIAVASPPKSDEARTGNEETGRSSCRTARGGWGQRARKDRSRNLGDPRRRELDEGINNLESVAGGSRTGP